MDVERRAEAKAFEGKLWQIVETLQRIAMLGDLDEEDFRDLNKRCREISKVIELLQADDVISMDVAKAMLEYYT